MVRTKQTGSKPVLPNLNPTPAVGLVAVIFDLPQRLITGM
jgi:hypothetical protein